MRRLTILVVGLALLYSGYWFIGATATERGLRGALSNLEQEGWSADYDQIKTRGFPSRFDTSFRALSLASPDGSIGVDTPRIDMMALSYQPNKAIFAVDPNAQVTLGGQRFGLTTEQLRASTHVAANTALSLVSATAEVGAATLYTEESKVVSVQSALIALRQSDPIPHRYDMYLKTQMVALPPALRAIFDPNGRHPEHLSQITLDISATFDRDLDRYSLATLDTQPLRVAAFEIKELNIAWGDMSLTGDGAITIADNGQPEGQITLRALEWRDMLRAVENAQLLQMGILRIAEGFGETLAGDEPLLTLPLRFQNGNMALGPLPLGPAPRFY